MTLAKDVFFLEAVAGLLIAFNWYGSIDVWMGLAFLILYAL
ncbi:MAG: hypothetical protein P4M11_13325 [Candidatus Pacebacteria bacterium]|nr:hypothetical protein [Candidatus Paceibacterota bacterium]